MHRPVCLTVLTVVLWLASPGVFAVPVWGEDYTLSQPDGTVVQVRVWGDEYYRRMETPEGYTVVREPVSGVLCYAEVSADGARLESTGIAVKPGAALPKRLQAHAQLSPEAVAAVVAPLRAQAAALEKQLPKSPLASESGSKSTSVQGLCLLIDFSDDPSTVPVSSFNNFLNQPGYTGNGNNGSVRDYFYEVSDGALIYTNTIPSAYYRAAHARTYYEDSNVAFGVRASELILEALQWLDTQGHNFAQYDSDGDTYIDAINVYYAGVRRPDWSVGLWPHASGVFGFSADGVSSGRYQMTDIGAYPVLGTICHENGHMVCQFPDLYDYGFESNGVGFYCLMGYGSGDLNPVEPCAPLKMYANWVVPTELGVPQAGLSLSTGTNQCYRLSHPDLSTEFYMLENRQATGRDALLPDSGLALWHVDLLASNDNEQMTSQSHYLVTLMQADGLWDLEHGANYGDANDLFSADGVEECSPITTPNTHWWSGSTSLARFYGISASGTTMTFNYGLSNASFFTLTPATISRIVTLGGDVTDTISVYNPSPTPVAYTLSITNESTPGVFSISAESGVSGGAAQHHALSYAVHGLDYGVYTATLTVDGAAHNTPYSIPLQVTLVPTLAEGLDYDGVLWESSGASAWTGSTVAGVSDGDCARSGVTGDMQSSVLSTEVYGPATLSFYWRVSSEPNYDYLHFYIDGVLQSGSISGLTTWAQQSHALSSGAHLLEWVYQKDAYVMSNEDAGWVDQVVLEDLGCTESGACLDSAPLGYLPGDSLCLTVPCPLWGADGFAWHKDGVALLDGGRVSGASSRTLHIDNLAEDDEGHYACAYTRGGEPVNTYRTHVLVVESLPGPHGELVAVLAAVLLGTGWIFRRLRSQHQ